MQFLVDVSDSFRVDFVIVGYIELYWMNIFAVIFDVIKNDMTWY